MTPHEIAGIVQGVAEARWTVELLRVFGRRAGEVRHTKAAEGEPGTMLRRLFVARVNADRDAAEAIDAEGRRIKAALYLLSTAKTVPYSRT